MSCFSRVGKRCGQLSFDDASFQLDPGEKVGPVDPNVAAAGRKPTNRPARRLSVLGALALGVATLSCSRPAHRYPENPVFVAAVREVPGAPDLLSVEIDNRSNRALHFSEPTRWNYVNLVKIGFRAYQPVIPVEAPGAVSDRVPDRDGDMVRVLWVLPLEGGEQIEARSRARRTIRVPEQLGGGRYSLALVVIARSQGRWLTVETPVLGRRTADLPGSVRALAALLLGCLLLAGAALLSLALPRGRGFGA